jgi:hypothetical protein
VDRVWLQHDSTDAEIARQLVERGIPQSQIVIGFQPERFRKRLLDLFWRRRVR